MKYLNPLIVLLVYNISHAQYAQRDWEDRDQWMPLEALFEMAKLQEGMDVADIGCHEGYLSFHLANLLGDQGTVYAVDVRADRLKTLQQKADKDGVDNINTILGTYSSPQLTEGVLDIIFIVDTYHEIGDYVIYLTNLKDYLKPGGRLVILEKLKTEHVGKPRQQQAFGHTLAMEYVVAELQEAGYKIVDRRHDMGHWERNEEKIIWTVVAEVR
ncbi:class I SAM-dependent methyltransferase [Aureitalea marina]|uniref:Methyltransferase domain-containing protein n=1 Tax=Aureitalea marina TaxID=930804 RepID=A0A2S7KP78_9FLAO|nr:methyltransferase domain-containing protein [Aureitalea marina]PQB04410.1 hypothetical protein BST85_05485 [Aureitalea marina]